MGKTLIFIGIMLIALGLFLNFNGKIPFLGKLPGDIYIKRDNFSFYFPVTTCIVISIIISIILKFFKK